QVAPGSRWQLGRVGAPGSVRAVGGWGDRQHAADRLDPICPTMIVDEGDHRLNGRSSSAWAKYADALRRISLAWRSSRFSRSSALIRSPSCVVGPARRPWSRSDRRVTGQITTLTEGNERRQEVLRKTVEERLDAIRRENTEKLDQMRVTVDEKLQSTLDQRLGASFQIVADRLEQVYRIQEHGRDADARQRRRGSEK